MTNMELRCFVTSFRAMTAARLLLLRPPLLEHIFQIRLCDLMQFIPHPDGRLADGNDAPEVHRGPDHDDVAIGGRDGLLQFLDLLRTIAHRGQHGAEMRIGSKHLTDRSDRVWSGIEEVLDAVLPRSDHARSLRRATVRARRPS